MIPQSFGRHKLSNRAHYGAPSASANKNTSLLRHWAVTARDYGTCIFTQFTEAVAQPAQITMASDKQVRADLASGQETAFLDY